MRTYVVFDCRAEQGVNAATFFGPRWLAHFAACVFSALTGRLHDYDVA